MKRYIYVFRLCFDGGPTLETQEVTIEAYSSAEAWLFIGSHVCMEDIEVGTITILSSTALED